MPKATFSGGQLKPIDQCYLLIPRFPRIVFKILPDITDQKGADYSDESIIGRSSPLKTYSSSQNRTIGMQIHFVVSHPDDVIKNLRELRAIESCVYPRTDKASTANAPFAPPPVCRLRCGALLADEALCVVLKSYSVKFPTEVSWDEKFFTPFKFDVDTNWDVVYKTSELPGMFRILKNGKG